MIPNLLLTKLAKDRPSEAMETLNNGQQLAITPYVFATCQTISTTKKTLSVWYQYKKRRHIVFRLTALQINNKVKIKVTSRIAAVDRLTAALIATIWEDLDDVLSHEDKIIEAELVLDEAFRRGIGWHTKYSPPSEP